MHFLMTLLVGTAGGLLFRRWKVPAGMMVGALVATALWNIAFGAATVPGLARSAAQIVAGAFSGAIITRSNIRQLPSVIRPVLWVLSAFFVINAVMGTLLARCFDMDLITGYLSMIPGSAMNTPIIAADYDADVTTVSVLQIVRLFMGLGAFPSMIVWYGKHRGEQVKLAASTAQRRNGNGKTSHRLQNILLTILIATVSGGLGMISHIPGGALIFATVGVMIMNVVSGCACLPPLLKLAAQVVSGCYIGAHIGRSDLSLLVELLLPAALIVLVYSVNCFAMGHLLQRKFGYSIRKAMLMVTPAGAADMLLISSDVGVEDPDLIVVHTIRMLAVVTVFPPMVGILARLLGG